MNADGERAILIDLGFFFICVHPCSSADICGSKKPFQSLINLSHNPRKKVDRLFQRFHKHINLLASIVKIQTRPRRR